MGFGGGVGGLGLGVVVDRGLGEHERTVLGLFVVFRIGGVEVDAGAPFQRGEESGCHVGPYPVGHPIQLVAGHEVAVVVVVAAGVHLQLRSVGIVFQRRRERNG